MKILSLVTNLLLLSNCVFSELTKCHHEIYCQGPILEYVSRAKIFKDSKTFVDMKLKNSPKNITDDFNALLAKTKNNPSKEDINSFVREHFEETEELEEWIPPDYNPNPKFLNDIKNETIKEFAKDLVAIWATLGRKTKEDVQKNPELHSLMPLSNGFVIPGGRFKEIYYWDSYWVIEGLLVSEMTTTVRGILENFASLISKYGFIPNGSRIYYLDRSHPPFFTVMAYAYVLKTLDVYWLKRHLTLMDKELTFWLTEKTVTVTKDKYQYTLAHYVSGSYEPRPESYPEDVETCASYKSKEDKENCYHELKSSAESGWDFSSRWFFDKRGGNNANLSHINATRLVPVDLNALLAKSFTILGKIYLAFGNSSRAKFWNTKATEWQIAIEQVLYYRPHGMWYDYDLALGQHRRMFYPSNFAPLAVELLGAEVAKERGCLAAKYVKLKGLNKYPGGIPASVQEQTGQQWDFPNAWPPLQDAVVSALYHSGCPEAKKLGEELAQIWLDSMINGYNKTEKMFEKYDARKSGEGGGGGEYQVQTGFGWTNGYVLKLIENIIIKKNA